MPVVVPPGPVKVMVSPGVAVMVVLVITDEEAACGVDVLVNVKVPLALILLITRLDNDDDVWLSVLLEKGVMEPELLVGVMDSDPPVPEVVEFSAGKGGSEEKLCV